MKTTQTAVTGEGNAPRKRGRPYKNPNLVPQAVADYIKQLRDDRNQLLTALKSVWSDTNARFGRDPLSNMPISEIVGTAIRSVEKHMSPKELEKITQLVADIEDSEFAINHENL